MATRSRIGFQLDDYSIHSVYCHWDGSPSHNGKILLEDYNEAAKVRELVSHGAISSLKTDRDWNRQEREPQPLYYVERGEPVEILVSDLEGFLSADCGEEYCYLFTVNGEWKCFDLGRSDGIAQVDLAPAAFLSLVA